MESKKLKPAKQALADAIHQNGGWVEVATFAVSGYGCVGTTDAEFVISFFNGKSKPSRDGENYQNTVLLFSRICVSAFIMCVAVS